MSLGTYSYGLGMFKRRCISYRIDSDDVSARYRDEYDLDDKQPELFSTCDISVLRLFPECWGSHICLFYSIRVAVRHIGSAV